VIAQKGVAKHERFLARLLNRLHRAPGGVRRRGWRPHPIIEHGRFAVLARIAVTARDTLELIFKHSGGVELRRVVDGKLDTVAWASDSDQDFMDEFGNEIMSADEDAEAVMDYLEDAEVITEAQADALEIYDESLDGTQLDPDDDDDGDEDDEFEDIHQS
jgi:hypothetical protein